MLDALPPAVHTIIPTQQSTQTCTDCRSVEAINLIFNRRKTVLYSKPCACDESRRNVADALNSSSSSSICFRVGPPNKVPVRPVCGSWNIVIDMRKLALDEVGCVMRALEWGNSMGRD